MISYCGSYLDSNWRTERMVWIIWFYSMELLPQVAELDGIKRDLGILGRHFKWLFIMQTKRLDCFPASLLFLNSNAQLSLQGVSFFPLFRIFSHFFFCFNVIDMQLKLN